MAKSLAWLTVNHECNLCCNWCYQRGVTGTNKKMPLQLAKELIDLCSGLSVSNVILIGGEPTLYPYFLDIIKYIRNKNIEVSVVTNSVKFANNEFVKKTKEAGINAINTSIKGSSAKEYTKATGCNVFDLVEKAIKNVRNSEIDQQISITVCRSIIENWKQMISFVKKCEVRNFIFSFEKPTILSAENISFDDTMMPNNVARFVQDIMYPSLLETKINFKIELIFPHCFLDDNFVKKLEDSDNVFGGCLLLKCNRRIVFDPDGFILPCNHFTNYPLGQYGKNFKSPSEFLAWKQSEEIKSFYQMTQQAPGERCAKCDKWSKCGAGCRLYWLYKGPNELLPII